MTLNKKSYMRLLIFSLLMFTFTFCNKQLEGTYFDLREGEIELFYNETQCADPWYEFFNKKEYVSLDKAEKLKLFLISQDIEVLQIAYVKDENGTGLICEACKCFTGSRFYVKIRENRKDDLQKLQQFGFLRHGN